MAAHTGHRRMPLAPLLVACVSLLSLLSCPMPVSARVTHPIFSAPREQLHSSRHVARLEVLQRFHITHGTEGTPLPGFHPEAPPVEKPELPVKTAAAAAPVNDSSASIDLDFGGFSDNSTLSAGEELDITIVDADAESEEGGEPEAEWDERDLAHWSVGGAPHSYHKGQAQLFPDRITLHFSAFGEAHALDLHIIRELYNEDSRVEVFELGDTPVSTHRHVLQSYWATLADGSGWATATLHRDGKFQAIVHRDGDTLQVDPVELHKQEMDEDAFHALHRAAHHHQVGHPGMAKGLVAFRHSDQIDLHKTHRCGGVERASEGGNTTVVHDEPLLPYTASARRLLQTASATAVGYGNFPKTAAGIVAWTNCWAGDTQPQKVSVGFAVDAGMYAVWGSVAGVQQYIAWQMAVINLVYLTQLRVFLTISDVVIMSTLGVPGSTTATWNDFPPTVGGKCPITIQTKLNTLTSWKGTAAYRTKNTVWTLLTNCYPPSGTVGLAWIDVLCDTYYSTGIATYTSNMWLTTAHELGHNFGAQHSFQLGQGSTGGIMDYGDGRLNGIFQFHTTYNKAEVCAAMKSMAYTTGITPFCSAPFKPACGNGVLEPGEACDDTSACCGQPTSSTPCQLTASSQCSGESPCCSACKFKPSSTTCMGGLGLCQNGFCAASACQGFSNLQFCGVQSNEPCRQQCKAGATGTCSSAYTSPNLNVPDGTVCRVAPAPYSICVAGVCQASGSSSAPAVTYTWTTTPFGACSCSGTQTRAAYCTGSDNSVGVEGTHCTTATKPALSQSCPVPSSCTTYSWQRSAFGTCPVNCGGGVATATVQCISSATGAAVTDASCTASTKPLSTQACNTPACPTAFVYSAWSACSVGCGGGTQSRTATCYQTQNGVQTPVVESACTGKLATSQACNTQACVVVTAPVVSYILSYGAWGSCSATCGTGSQSRSAFCLSSSGATVATSFCGCGAGTATPVCLLSVQSCNTHACPVYAWTTGAWSTCSLTCGGGVQTRAVTCMDTTNNLAVATTQCILAKPSGAQSCNTHTCTAAKWVTGPWQPCTKPCADLAGGGNQIRAVNCVDAAGVVVAATQCSGQVMPVSKQFCNLQQCPQYQWLIGPWSSCSAWCGGGTQTRTVKCVAIGSVTAVSYTNCDTTNVPPTAQYCNTAVTCPLNSDVQWKLASWSDCSTVCGNDAVRTRNVLCTNSTTGAEIDAKFCPQDFKPEVTSMCPNITCPTYWHTTDWSPCTASCEGGSQKRQVECRYVAGDLKIDDSRCTGTRPSEEADCNLHPCPKWQVGAWSNCSTRCGDGLMTRPATCVSWDNQALADTACAASPLPVTEETCNNMPCPHWHRSPWGYCDQVCGGGNQTRELVCRMPHDDVWHGQRVLDETLCPPVGQGDAGDGIGDANVAYGRPAFWQRCNTLPCPTYYWDVVKYSACSAECGGGTQTGSAVCRSAADSAAEVAPNLCLGAPPSTSRACNVDPCPKYEWMAPQPWSNCSVSCGAGTQTRPIRCANLAPAAWKNVAWEAVPDESNCAELPKLPSIQGCAFPRDICNGKVVDAQGVAMASPVPNGMCTAEGKCLCRAGWGGDYCDQSPQIKSVLTNGAAYTESGIPFGDALQITWETDGSLPYVSVLLLRNNAADPANNWNVASYIAQNVINTGKLTWLVGTGLPELESGDGFSVRVWFSQSVWAQSAKPFTIADPCAYKSCGTHGTCGLGGVCECVKGYSGAVCSLGPCERARCSTSYGSCLNEDYIGLPDTDSTTVGICRCGQDPPRGFYDGFQCRTPPGCTPKCKNGADLVNIVIDLQRQTSEAAGQCGICACNNLWGGHDCGTCELECANGGVADDDCATCNCSKAPGFQGTTCACRFYTVSLKLTVPASAPAPASWLDDPVAVARFSRTLATDLALAAGQVTGINVQIDVTSVVGDPADPRGVVATVRFGVECPQLSADRVMTGASINSEQARRVRGIVTHAEAKDGQAFNNLLSHRTLKDPANAAFFPTKAMSELRLAREATTAASTSSTSSPAGTASTASGSSSGSSSGSHLVGSSSDSVIGPGSSATWSGMHTGVVVEDGRPTLLSVYGVVASSLEDLSSPFYRGVLTSELAGARVVAVKDESGIDKPRTPGEPTDPFQAAAFALNQPAAAGDDAVLGGLGIGAWIGLGLGVVVLLICVAAVVAHYYRTRIHQVAYKDALASQRQRVEGGVELPPSSNATPLDTPHTTPPQQGRTLGAGVKLQTGRYAAAPIAEEGESQPTSPIPIAASPSLGAGQGLGPVVGEGSVEYERTPNVRFHDQDSRV